MTRRRKILLLTVAWAALVVVFLLENLAVYTLGIEARCGGAR